MMLGYLDNPEGTASTIQASGWLKLVTSATAEKANTTSSVGRKK